MRAGATAGQGEKWLLVLSLTRSLFSRLQKDLCWAHLPRLFSAAMNCFLSPHSQVVSAAAQTLEVLCLGASPSLAALVLAGSSVWGFGTCRDVVCPSVPPRLGVHSPLLLYFPCLSLQTLLSECVAPHMDDLGTVTASAPAPATYLCKMFR